jgi:hypothetical protein
VSPIRFLFGAPSDLFVPFQICQVHACKETFHLYHKSGDSMFSQYLPIENFMQTTEWTPCIVLVRKGLSHYRILAIQKLRSFVFPHSLNDSAYLPFTKEQDHRMSRMDGLYFPSFCLDTQQFSVNGEIYGGDNQVDRSFDIEGKPVVLSERRLKAYPN